MHDAICSKCGKKIRLIFKSQTAVHASCPSRGPRAEAPAYIRVPEEKN